MFSLRFFFNDGLSKLGDSPRCKCAAEMQYAFLLAVQPLVLVGKIIKSCSLFFYFSKDSTQCPQKNWSVGANLAYIGGVRGL